MHQKVEPVNRRADFRQQGAGACWRADVRFYGVGLRAKRRDFGACGVGRSVVALIDHEDIGARLGETLGDREADALRAAGYENRHRRLALCGRSWDALYRSASSVVIVSDVLV
jgi:hypothetical protein